MAQEIFNRIGKNSLYNLSLRTLSFPLWIVLPPIILRFIGVDGYGIWAFIQVFVNYGGVLNLGIDTTITKFTAEYKAKEDLEKISRLFNTFLVIYFFIFVLFCVAVVVCRELIMDVFMKTDRIPRADISFALILYAATFTMKSIYKVYPSFFNGLERMDLTNKIEMLSFSCMFVFSILFLFLGWGIKGLAAASALSALITMSVYMLVCAELAPYLRINPVRFSTGIIYEVRKYIAFGAVGGVTSIAHFQLNKVIITYFLGLQFLTYYDLGHKLISAMFSFLCSFITPIMPAASGVHASLGIGKLREIYETTIKYLSLMAAPIFLFSAVFANQIIMVWLGAGYEEAAFVLRFLSIAYLVLILTGPGASVLTGMGEPEIPFYGNVLTAGANVILSLILVNFFGLAGIIVSDITANTICLLFSFYFYQKRLDSGIHDILRSVKFPFFTSTGILLVLGLFAAYVGNTYVQLALAAVLFSVSYIMLACLNPAFVRLKEFIQKPLFFFTYRS